METLIVTLIYICLVVAAGWLVLWVLRSLGIPLPERAIQILWVIVALIVILVLWRSFGHYLSLGRLPG